MGLLAFVLELHSTPGTGELEGLAVRSICDSCGLRHPPAQELARSHRYSLNMAKVLLSRSEEGQRIQEIADQIPPIPVRGFSTTIQAITYTVTIIATGIVFLRVWVRWKLSGHHAWGWDDIFAVAGWVHLILLACLLATQLTTGPGSPHTIRRFPRPRHLLGPRSP